jgi:hypothetical protein
VEGHIKSFGVNRLQGKRQNGYIQSGDFVNEQEKEEEWFSLVLMVCLLWKLMKRN